MTGCWLLVAGCETLFLSDLGFRASDFCYNAAMWPFKKKKAKNNHIAKRVIAGLIIGGAIGSIVGKKLLEEHEREDEDEQQK